MDEREPDEDEVTDLPARRADDASDLEVRRADGAADRSVRPVDGGTDLEVRGKPDAGIDHRRGRPTDGSGAAGDRSKASDARRTVPPLDGETVAPNRDRHGSGRAYRRQRAGARGWDATRLAWELDPLNSRTVRWVVLGQLALVDAGLLLAVVGGLAAFAFAVEHGSLAVFAVVGLLGLAWRRGTGHERAIVPIERWRWRGTVEYLTETSIALALAAGGLWYLALFRLLGVGALAVLAACAVATGIAAGPLGDGRVAGRIDRSDETLRFDGRTRSLATIAGTSSYRLGDLAYVRLRGPTGLDEPTWLAAPAAGVAGLTAALEGAATDDCVDEPDALPGIGWRRLQAPHFSLSAAGVVLAATGVGLAAVLGGTGWVAISAGLGIAGVTLVASGLLA